LTDAGRGFNNDRRPRTSRDASPPGDIAEGDRASELDSGLLGFAPIPDQQSCVDNTKLKPGELVASATDQEDTEGEEELAGVPGVPIWNHGSLEQAKLAPVRHAVHLVRYLDDYHEPTLAALRRQRGGICRVGCT
jgi:hypothetical protein